MIYDILDSLKKFFSSRLFVMGALYVALFALLLGRLFYLQIAMGQFYRDNFELQIHKTLSIDSSRGNIYDCNGRLLAYNELAYSVVMSDMFESSRDKNNLINDVIAQTIEAIEANGDTLVNEFKIAYDPSTDEFSFTVDGTQLDRFRADVFGRVNFDSFQFNDTFKFDEAKATPEQVMQFLYHDDNKYNVDEEKYSKEMAYKIVVVRYALSENRFNRHKTSVMARNVSDQTVAYIAEHSDTLLGVSIEEDTIRKYNYSEYFASLIGYTGRISSDEFLSLSEEDDSYTQNDMIGKSGLEQYYESYLRGNNGSKDVYLDNVGRIVEVISETKPVAGNDLYLSIDAELQKNIYNLLEQELAGIVYESIKSGYYTANDVYFALINNSVIDLNEFDDEDATDNEREIYNSFAVRQSEVIGWIGNELSSGTTTVNQMSDELLDYTTEIINLLKDNKILLRGEIDTNDEVYNQWKNGTISLREYLNYCISQQWIDITLLDVPEQYADSSEIYQSLMTYILSEIAKDKAFSKIIYHYMVMQGRLSGNTLCMILYDQGVLDYDEASYNGLASGAISAYAFMLDKIYNLEITPAQLALDPCTGSVVLTDAKTGALKALVSYPGYDNNRLANTVDAKYFAHLNEDLSKPQYNYATQERTAPGSTFKMVTSTAGLAEGVIDTSSLINCSGVFTELDEQPRCWNHSGHGEITVQNAIRTSCNVFYYNVGYRMSMDSSNTYNDPLGISKIQKYASLYGLDKKSGLEIEENESAVADEYPVMAAIGQSNNNYTTVALSRYVTGVATGNLFQYQLMDKIVDGDGNIIANYNSNSEDISSVLNNTQWNAIRTGMLGVVEDLSCFNDAGYTCAGKTGTAQQSESRPTHAVFVGYAPYEDPSVTIATRIAFGGSSHNAGQIASNVLRCYFNTVDINALVDGHAEEETSAVVHDDVRSD